MNAGVIETTCSNDARWVNDDDAGDAAISTREAQASLRAMGIGRGRSRRRFVPADELAFAIRGYPEAVCSPFLATMSHEIRTPLNAIMGMVQLLELEDPTPGQRKRLNVMRDASYHLLAIINDVLDLAQIESGGVKVQRLPFAVADLVERALAMVVDRSRTEPLEFRSAIGDGVPRNVVGDSRRVEQILVNLLRNAVKFTPHGSVEVEVSSREVAGQIELRFEVRDSGVGMSPEQMSRLFQPFAQLDPWRARGHGGTGLGLTISRHLAGVLGGDCGATSAEGQGSQFWFTVMVGAGAANLDIPSRDPVSGEFDPAQLSRALAGRRLLIVEDDRVNQMILTDMLRSLGDAQVDIVDSGEQAIDEVAVNAYDVILMDVQLPGIDGLTATSRIRQLPRGLHPRIVALSGNVLPQDVAQCKAAGMDAHLPKPVCRKGLAMELLRSLAIETQAIPR